MILGTGSRIDAVQYRKPRVIHDRRPGCAEASESTSPPRMRRSRRIRSAPKSRGLFEERRTIGEHLVPLAERDRRRTKQHRRDQPTDAPRHAFGTRIFITDIPFRCRSGTRARQMRRPTSAAHPSVRWHRPAATRSPARGGTAALQTDNRPPCPRAQPSAVIGPQSTNGISPTRPIQIWLEGRSSSP